MNYPKLPLKIFLFLSYILISWNLIYSQSIKDSLHDSRKLTKPDTIKILSLLDKGDDHYYTYPDSTLIYYKQALKLSQKANNIKYEASSLLNIGYYLGEKELYKESLEYYLKAIGLYESIDDKIGVANCNYYIGINYSHLNSLNNAIKYYVKALDIYTKENDSLGIADIYSGYGNLHYDQENYDKAHNYYLKSFDIYKALNNKGGLLASYINIANTISDKGDIAGGLEYYFKSIKLSQELNDKEGLAINYANIGECYIDNGNYDKAKDYLNKSLQITKEINFKSLYPNIYTNFAQVNLKLKKYDEVVLNAKTSLEYSKKTSFVDMEYDAYAYLSEAQAELGDFKIAYENHKLYKQFSDSIFNLKNTEELAKLDILNQLENHESKINLLTKNEEVRVLQLKNQKRLSYILFASILFFLILTALLIKQRNERKKAYSLLSIEKEKAEESDRLKSSFLANMSHEIRTPMSAIMGFSSLLKDPDLEPQKKDRFVDVIIKSGERLMAIINDIIDISKIESDQMKIDIKDVNITNTLTEIVEIQKETNELLINKNIELRLNLPISFENIIIKTDENRFTQIINNLINNASKFTGKGFIEVGFRLKENSSVEFYVKDTGYGIPEDKFNMIFDRFSQAGEKDFKTGNGLGLSICKGLLIKLRGKMRLISKVGTGTTFYFTLPY